MAPIYEEREKAIYCVDRRGGPPWVLRIFPRSRPLVRTQGDAAILRYVERHGIDAERVVVATDGSSTSSIDGRGVLVTRFIEGTRPDRSADTLRQLGEVAGRLHALPPVPVDDPLLARRARALPKEDLAFGQSCLDRVACKIPREHLGDYQRLRAALAATHDGEDLPRGLIHSDGHLANALLTPEGKIVFFDWDGAGQGPKVAALGLLLYSCVVQAPDDQPVPRDLSRVDSVIDGYRRQHVLTSSELDYLPDAVRFRPVVVAARNFAEDVERGLSEHRVGWWTRYADADAVADRARRAMPRIQ